MVKLALEEISKIAAGETFTLQTDEVVDESWPIESKMGLVISRAAMVIAHTPGGKMEGAPMSIIIGTIAGIAMEAEMMTVATSDFMDALRSIQSDN